MNSNMFRIATATLLAGVAYSPQLFAQTISSEADNAVAAGEIVVTAQKREQRLNDVPMAVAVLGGDDLRDRNIANPEQLIAAVPGFSYSSTQYDTPVYTLRGIGFVEASLAATPAVSVYVDQVPLPYPAMTKGAILDLDRVEVLKGPQGTLFGQNSSGGSVNYIAAKPTRTPAAGFTLGYGRFDAIDASAFVSGPLSDAIRVRVAAKFASAGPWQKSRTRDDEIGRVDELIGRLLVEYDAGAGTRIELNLNGWRDRSDTQVPQLIALRPAIAATASQNIRDSVFTPTNARQADWTAGLPLERRNRMVQASLRLTQSLGDFADLTTITSYQHLRRASLQDTDGSPFEGVHSGNSGTIGSFFQEIRLAPPTAGRVNWVLGATFARDNVYDTQQIYIDEASNSNIAGIHYRGVDSYSDQNVRTLAVFASGDLEITEGLRLEAGVRYTHDRRIFEGCSGDIGDGQLVRVIARLQGIFKQAAGLPPPTQTLDPRCLTLNSNFDSAPALDRLAEGNLSWRAGLNYKTGNDGLIFASASRGYKSGSFPTLAASSARQFRPVTQESVLAFEAGVKQPITRGVQLNASAYYYDYTDKQLRARVLDPTFGPLEALVNVPKSRAIGAELELSARPIPGLSLSLSGAFLDTKIKRFTGFDQLGIVRNFAGTPFPFAPKWSGVADVQYDWSLSEDLTGYVGGSLSARSATRGAIDSDPLFRIDGYSLLDLRAGVKNDEGWSVSLWARNVTNRYYWNSAFRSTDVVVRFAGRPATFGLTIGYQID